MDVKEDSRDLAYANSTDVKNTGSFFIHRQEGAQENITPAIYAAVVTLFCYE